VKVLDFGIARVDGTRLTETGAAPGTPTYMSPEQIRNKELDGRSDLYSLACILYELVTGQVPFSGGNSLGLAYMHVHETPKRASEMAPKAGVTPAIDAFLMRALAKEPSERPKHAGAFREELQAAVAEVAKLPAPVAKVESKPIAKVEPKPPKVEPKPEPVKRPTPKPASRGGGSALARITQVVRGSGSLFRRRKSLGQRIMARVRRLRGRRVSRRWAGLVIGSVIAVSLVIAVGFGVGWHAFTRTAAKQAVTTPAKSAPAKPPTRTKKSGSGSRR